jgi:hypothetical protein
MSTSNELARLHIETAIKLVGRETVLAMVAAASAPAAGGATGVTASLTGAPTQQKDSRGRRPGAAPDDMRCQWKLTDGSQCKNAMTAEMGYCKIHITKVDLIDL